MVDSETFELCSSRIEYKSENGKFYTEGYLQVAGDVDISGDVCTEHCIDSIVSQCLGSDMKAVTSSTATRKALKMSADHAHLNPKLGGDRREMPVGKVVESKKVYENGKAKAWVKTEVNSFHPEYESIKGCIENKYFDSYSIEFFAIDAKQEGNKRILNDVKLTGAAYTGRPLLASATMTDFYAKSHTFEEFKGMMDKENGEKKDEDDELEDEYEKQKKEHPTVPDEMIRTIARDHINMKKGEKGKCDTMEKTEEKKSEVIAPIVEKAKEDIKSELLTKEQVKAIMDEEFKSRDLKTLEQIKSTIAEEIKKNAEEIKSKVLVVEEKKSVPKDEKIFDVIAKNQGWVK